MKKVSTLLLSDFRGKPKRRVAKVDNHPFVVALLKRSAFFLLSFFSYFPIYTQSFFESTFFRLSLGYGLYGSGNIIDGAGDGLKLIERGINSRILFSPWWTGLITQYGPVYKIRDLGLTSYSIEFEAGKTFHKSEFGWSLRYLDIGFNLQLPETYLDARRIFPGAGEDDLLFFPVTKNLRGRTLLVWDIQLGIFYHHEVFRWKQLEFFAGGGFGIGSGKLAYSGPYVNEIHGTITLGLRWQVSGNRKIHIHIKNLMATVKTGTSNRIDRRKVLVNPRKGEIFLTIGQAGITFF